MQHVLDIVLPVLIDSINGLMKHLFFLLLLCYFSVNAFSQGLPQVTHP